MIVSTRHTVFRAMPCVSNFMHEIVKHDYISGKLDGGEKNQPQKRMN